MTIKLDNETKIQFPTEETWSRFFKDWNASLIAGLGDRYDLMDRQDAVANAFVKLMYRKRKEEYAHVPETDREWYGCIRWQARAILQHGYESGKTREKYHKAAVKDLVINAPAPNYCGIDSRVRESALLRTLREVCRDARMKESNVEAYIRWYLNGEDSARVARELGTTQNNLHVIRFRVEKLLRDKGREKYSAVRARLFRDAA